MSVTSANSFALLNGDPSRSRENTGPKKRRRKKGGGHIVPVHENTDDPGDSQSEVSTFEGSLAANGHQSSSTYEPAAAADDISHANKAQQPASAAALPNSTGAAVHVLHRAANACMCRH